MILSLGSLVGFNPTRLIGAFATGSSRRSLTFNSVRAVFSVRAVSEIERRLLSRYTTRVTVRSRITGTSTVLVTMGDVPESGSVIGRRRECIAKAIDRPNKTITMAATGAGTETDAVASLGSRF